MLENLHLASFAEHLQTKFQVDGEDAKAVELELVSAEDRGTNERQEQFSIIFRGPGDAFLAQGTYKVEHPLMGTFNLFLVPVGGNEDGFSYEASFNRLIKK